MEANRAWRKANPEKYTAQHERAEKRRKHRYLNEPGFRERVLERDRSYRVINGDALRRSEQKRRLFSQGLTLEEFDAILERQGGRCAACNTRPSGSNRQLVLDHCHKTNAIRGILCLRCNFALGHTQDSVERLQGLIDYLRTWEPLGFFPPRPDHPKELRWASEGPVDVRHLETVKARP